MMPAVRLLLRPWGVLWGHVMPVRQADGITCGRWVGALWARFARFAALASPSSKLAHLRMSKLFLRILFWHAPACYTFLLLHSACARWRRTKPHTC